MLAEPLIRRVFSAPFCTLKPGTSGMKKGERWSEYVRSTQRLNGVIRFLLKP